MKKTLVSMLLVIVTMFLMVTPAFAAESDMDVEQVIQTENGYTVYCFEDGSTLSVSPVLDKEERNAGSVSVLSSPAQTVTRALEATFNDSDGVLQWEYVLTASFSYVYGVSSTCTSASYTKAIYGKNWTFSNGSATRSGNSATGNGTFTKTVLLIVTKNYNIDLHLTCDIYGIVS